MSGSRRRLCSLVAAGVGSLLAGCVGQQAPDADPAPSVDMTIEARARQRILDGETVEVQLAISEIEVRWRDLDDTVAAILFGVDTAYGRLFVEAQEGSWPATATVRLSPGEFSVVERTDATREEFPVPDEGAGPAPMPLQVLVQLFDAEDDSIASASIEESISVDVVREETDADPAEEPERQLLVRVLDEIGMRLEGARVRVFTEEAAGDEPLAVTETGADGRSQIDVSDGRYTVAVDHPAYEGERTTVVVSGSDEPVVFMLEPETDAEEPSEGDDDPGEPADDDDAGEDRDDDEDDEPPEGAEDADDGAEDDDPAEDDDADDGFIF